MPHPEIPSRFTRTRSLAAVVLAGSILAASSCLANEAATAGDDSSPWTDDFAAASARAAETGRAILLDFTGSDWCGWCIRLRDEVFSQQHFLDYAREHLVLVEVDFPRRKILAPEVVEQNKQLDERFGVTGYPTIVILNSTGEEIGRLSYMEGGPKTFVRAIKRLIAADQRSRGT